MRNPTPATILFVLAGLVAIIGCEPKTLDVSDQIPDSAMSNVARMPKEDAGELVREHWDAHYVFGSRVGFRNTQIRKLDDDSLLIRSIDDLTFRRFGDVARQRFVTFSIESNDGRIRRLGYEIESGDQKQQVAGTVRGDELKLKGTRQATAPWSEDCHGYFAVEKELAQRPMRPGERRKVNGFLPLYNQPVEIRLIAELIEELAKHESETVGGSSGLGPVETQKLVRIRSETPLSGGNLQVGYYWTDARGQIVKQRQQALLRETIRVSEDFANSPIDDFDLDIALAAKVPLNQTFDRTRNQTCSLSSDSGWSRARSFFRQRSVARNQANSGRAS